MDIERRFTYHAPNDAQKLIYEQIREGGKQFAFLLSRITPESREQSLALTSLETAVFWANAAVARAKEEE